MIRNMENIMETIGVMENEDGNETQQFYFFDLHKIQIVVTLALGLRLRQGLAKERAKSEPKSHISCSRKCRRL
jgi:hypothetical protein